MLDDVPPHTTHMSCDGRVRLPQVLLVVVPGIAGEVWPRAGHGGPALDGSGASAGGGAHGAHGRDAIWRGLHGGAGGEEVAVTCGGVVMGGKSEVLGKGLVQIIIIVVRLEGGREGRREGEEGK